MESARLPCWTTFSQIVLKQAGQFVDFLADFVADRGRLQHIVQFVGQFGRKRCKIVDEIERVLDLVRDAGGELAERGELFGLHQAILRGAQVVERLRQIVGALPQFLEQPRIFDRNHGLAGKTAQQRDLLFVERQNLATVDSNGADQFVCP